MGTAQVTLADGKIAKITFDSSEQLDQAISDLAKVHTKDKGPNIVQRGMDRFTEAVREPVLKAVTGAAGSVVGGVRGVVSGWGAARDAAISDIMANKPQDPQHAREAFADEGARVIAETQNAMTRQPRTATGKAADEMVNTPFRLLAEGADTAGRKTAEATGSPAAGAAVNTVIQALPSLVVPAARGLARAGAGAGAAEELTATAAPRGAPSQVGEGNVPRGTPEGTPAQSPAEPQGATQAQGAPSTPPKNPNEARAQAYAGSIGLDWARLGAGTRKALTSIAQDSQALERLNPEAVKRQAHLESLRVPVRATRGQLERDPVQLRREAIASNTAEGQPIRDTDIAANRDLQANLEVLRGRVGGRRGGYEDPVDAQGNAASGAVRSPTKTPTQVGESLQGATRAKAASSKAKYNALYKKARETEPDARVSGAPLNEFLTSNPEVQHLGFLQGWLKRAEAAGSQGEFTLRELHDLREKAGGIARAGGTDGYYAGQVVKAIDETMKGAPEGAAAWKAANDAFRRHQQEFSDQGLIKQLVSNKKGGADRALALEKTANKIATGTVEQIRQVKTTLLKGENPALRIKGAAAWRDLRAETVNRILEDARNVTGADETERAILTEAALRRSINRIPRENLEEILGKGATRELYDILRARRITTRSPVGGRTTQSGTVPNALVLAEKVLKHIPGVKYALGAKHAIAELGERGAAGRAAKEATITPLEKAAQDVERSRPSFSKERRAAQYRAIEGTGPTLAAPAPQPTIADAVRRPPP
jgi:hypothetical protein